VCILRIGFEEIDYQRIWDSDRVRRVKTLQAGEEDV